VERLCPGPCLAAVLLYRREGRELLAFEQAVAARARCSFFVTENETALFRRLSPALRADVQALGNGVDANFFTPDPARASPFPAGQLRWSSPARWTTGPMPTR